MLWIARPPSVVVGVLKTSHFWDKCQQAIFGARGKDPGEPNYLASLGKGDVWTCTVDNAANAARTIAQATLNVRLFGELRVSVNARPLRLIKGSRKTQALLAFLILHREQVSARTDVAFRLWPDCSESEARANLRRHMYKLQQALPPGDWLHVDSQELRVVADANVAVDVDAFWAAMAIGDHEEAVHVYGGELLAGNPEEWLVPIRDRAARAYVSALSRCAAERAATGEAEEAMHLAHRLIEADPWREDTVRLIMQLYERLGDRAAALRFYQGFCDRLSAEFGVTPSAETLALLESIRSRKAPPMPDQMTLFDERAVDWVGGFPWWWVARLRRSPTALAVAAYLRTLETSRCESFRLPSDAHERLGISRRATERAMQEMCDYGIIEVADATATVPKSYRFVFDEPLAQRDGRQSRAKRAAM